MASRRPKVSLGMPLYNAESFLQEAMDSLLAQTFEDFEIVISDNASTDATGEMCRAYARKDDRIRYFRNEQNIGIIPNFNRVFSLSEGEYFKWAAGDDVCGADYLHLAAKALDDPSVVLVWARTVGIDQHGRRTPLPSEISDLNSPISVYSTDPVVRFRRLLRNLWWVDGPFYGVMRASALARTRWRHPRHPSGDQILLTELSLMGRFYEIPEELFFARVHAGKTSRKHSTLRDRAAFLDDAGNRVVDVVRALRVYPSRLGMYVLIIADAQIALRQKVLCSAEVFRAIGSWALLRARQVVSGSSPWR